MVFDHSCLQLYQDAVNVYYVINSFHFIFMKACVVTGSNQRSEPAGEKKNLANTAGVTTVYNNFQIWEREKETYLVYTLYTL